MIFTKTKGVFLTLIAMLSLLSASNAQFQIDGVVRPRFEYRDGYKTLKKSTDEPAAFVSQRARLKFDYTNDKIKTRFTLFDYRVWGDQLWKKDVASVGVHEVWAQVNLNETSKIRFGRQELKYDNSRLISPVNWNQIGAAHDGVKFIYGKNDFDVEVVTTWNQNKERNSGTDYEYDGDELNSLYYKNLNILWLSKKFDKLTLQSLTVIDGYEEVTNTSDTVDSDNPHKLNYRFTPGIIAKYKNNNFGAAARVFYQGGTLYTGQNVSAYYLNADLSYKISPKLTALVGVEVMSGNDYTDTTNTTSNAFDILYGGRHKFNGRIDYFSTPSTTKGAGLVNPYVKLTWSIADKMKLVSEYHNFNLQNNYVPSGETSPISKFLGHELDFTLYKSFNDYIHLSAGYSMMFASDQMEIIKGGKRDELNQWAFVMININPTLFKSKND